MSLTPRKRGRPRKPIYSITFTFGSEMYTGSGRSIIEALESVPRPVKIVGKGYLQLTDGTKSMSHAYMPASAKKLFYPLARTYLAKQLQVLLDAESHA